MQGSATYRYLQDKFTREAFVECTLAFLENRFNADVINALKPALLKINDIERLKRIHLAAPTVESLDAFAEMLREE